MGLIQCELRAEGSDEPGRCGWCAKDLPPRRSRWCSAECRIQYLANHYWAYARDEAVRLAGGWSDWTCARCGQHPERDPDLEYWRKDLSTPEVNHTIPRVGAGYAEGCWHHLDLLEVLCHACHVIETTLQIRERRGIPPEGRPGPGRWNREAEPMRMELA